MFLEANINNESKFTVGKVSPITISTKVPAVIYKNGALNITGSVSSSAAKLRQITVSLSNGKSITFSKTILGTSNTYTFSSKSVVNIANPKKGVDLHKAKPGKYTLSILVIDKNRRSDFKQYQVIVN